MSILPHEAKALLELFCLQPIIFGRRQNSSRSSFASYDKIKLFYIGWQDWIVLMIFKNFADQDWIGFNLIGSGLDSDWKTSQSALLWCTPLLYSAHLWRAGHLQCFRSGDFPIPVDLQVAGWNRDWYIVLSRTFNFYTVIDLFLLMSHLIYRNNNKEPSCKQLPNFQWRLEYMKTRWQNSWLNVKTKKK